MEDPKEGDDGGQNTGNQLEVGDQGVVVLTAPKNHTDTNSSRGIVSELARQPKHTNGEGGRYISRNTSEDTRRERYI